MSGAHGQALTDLYWNDQSLELCTLSSTLFGREEFADVTLACNGGKTFTGHRFILAAASNKLRDLINDLNPSQDTPHPVLELDSVEPTVLLNLLSYIYNGHASIPQNELKAFLTSARELGIDVKHKLAPKLTAGGAKKSNYVKERQRLQGAESSGQDDEEERPRKRRKRAPNKSTAVNNSSNGNQQQQQKPAAEGVEAASAVQIKKEKEESEDYPHPDPTAMMEMDLKVEAADPEGGGASMAIGDASLREGWLDEDVAEGMNVEVVPGEEHDKKEGEEESYKNKDSSADKEEEEIPTNLEAASVNLKLYYEGSRQKIGIISNRSGGNNIHSNGFIYSKHGCAKPDCILWYCCYRDSCKGKMITTLDYAEQRKGVLKIEHSHEPDFDEIKRKHVMAKLRAVALANPREKHQWVVDSLLQSIPDSVQDLLPGPEKLKGMVKNIRYCNAEFQAQISLHPPVEDEDEEQPRQQRRRRRRSSSKEDPDYNEGGGLSPKEEDDYDEGFDGGGGALKKEKKTTGKSDKKKREPKFKRDNMLGLGTTKEDFYNSGEPIKVEILGNKYGGNKLHYKGHMYTKLKAATERVWWRCIFQKKCKGMMVTLTDYTETKLAILRQGHTHRADPGAVAVERILSKIRVAAVTNFKDVPSVLIEKLLANVPENIKCLLPEVGLLRTLVYRTRRSSGAALMGHMANTQLHEELFAGSPGETENNIAVASTSAEAELEEAEEDEEEQGKEIFPIPKCGARLNLKKFYNSGPLVNFEIIGTKYGGKQLLANGQIYTKEEASGNRIRWRCSKRKICVGKIVTLRNFEETSHGILKAPCTHEGDLDAADRERVLSNIRVAAVQNFNESPEDIVAKALAPVSTRVRTILPDVNLLRSLVKRCRNSTGTTLMGHIANSELLEPPPSKVEGSAPLPPSAAERGSSAPVGIGEGGLPYTHNNQQ